MRLIELKANSVEKYEKILGSIGSWLPKNTYKYLHSVYAQNQIDLIMLEAQYEDIEFFNKELEKRKRKKRR
jgi:hypothetical protein